MKSITYATIADVHAIKLSFGDAAGGTYSGVALDGVIGPAVMNPARTVKVTTAAAAAAYTIGSTVVVNGRDLSGAVISETFTITNANGGETLAGIKGFSAITSVVQDPQALDTASFQIGVRDIICNDVKMIRIGHTGALKLGFKDGTTDTLLGLLVGDKFKTSPSIVYGDTSTTTSQVTLFR